MSAESVTIRSQGRVGSGARPFQEEGTASAKTARQEEAWRRPFLPRNLPSEGPGFPAVQHGPVPPLPRALTQIQKKFPVPQYGQPYHTLFNFSPDSPPSHKPSGFFQDPGKEAVFTSSGPFPSSLHCSHFHKLQATLTSHIKGFQGRGSINHLIQPYI